MVLKLNLTSLLLREEGTFIMETYSFDDPDDAQEAVKTAMAEAGCFGPDLEKSCAGKSPEKNLISSFIRWRDQKVTMRMTVTVTKGLGKY